MGNDIYNNNFIINNDKQNKSSMYGYSKSFSRILSDAHQSYDIKQFSFNEENSGDITNISNIFGGKIVEKKAKKILEYLEFKMDINVENNHISIEYEDIICGKDKEIITSIIDLHRNYNYSQEKSIIYKNYQKLLSFFDEIEEYIKNAKIKKSSQIKMKIEKNEKKVNKNKNIYYMTCASIYENFFKNNKEYAFKDENILVNNIDSMEQGFIYLINELSNNDYSFNNMNNNIINDDI